MRVIEPMTGWFHSSSISLRLLDVLRRLQKETCHNQRKGKDKNSTGVGDVNNADLRQQNNDLCTTDIIRVALKSVTQGTICHLLKIRMVQNLQPKSESNF